MGYVIKKKKKKQRLFGKNRTYIKLKLKCEPWKKSLHTCGQSQTSVCGQENSSGISAEASQIPQRFWGLKNKNCYFKIQTHFVLFSFSICSNGHWSGHTSDRPLLYAIWFQKPAGLMLNRKIIFIGSEWYHGFWGHQSLYILKNKDVGVYGKPHRGISP